MSQRDPGLVFVTGAWKTATSPLVALLNAHPDVFVLYEAILFADPPSRRGRQFLAAYPEAGRFFVPDAGPEDYLRLQAWLASIGYPSVLFGDKVPTLSVEVLRKLSAHPVVYCVRDVRTWLVKRQIRSAYGLDADIVPAAASFCRHLLWSFTLDRRLHVRTETFVEDNERVVDQLGGFLDVDLAEHCSEYWLRLGEHPAGSPKAAVRWWESSHRTSTERPTSLDVSVTLRPHPFWDELLPIFDRYFGRLNSNVDRREIERDLAALEAVAERHRVPLAEAYASVASSERPPGGKSLVGRVRRLRRR